ncbi:L domain-like protein [Trichodelitschia bisporula]|uniref:L domain-like protein n=1 Tax=Trichodelitschia bisporula TaxID=703511 RepID=A0A6G1HYE0_9PEZI|nr:L domain-like protein [Trichodelitschia bisporula]
MASPTDEPHIQLPATTDGTEATVAHSPRNSRGWDGKLRIERRAVVNESEPESEDDDAPPLQQIEADEDLCADLEDDTTEIDLVHCRIQSIPALRLERFQHVERLCLRQNQITAVEFPPSLASTLKDLDLYDNLISSIKGLEDFSELTSLDFSFNKIKHIRRVNHLQKLTDLYFVQNKISVIENLEGLTNLTNLELGGNRIRTIQNLETLTALEKLWLGKNKLTSLSGLDTLSNLKILSIQSNRLHELSGLESLPQLEELYVSHNALTEISGLSGNTNLRVLDISANPLEHLTGLEAQSQLEELWASSCKLDSFEEVEQQLRDKAELQTVYLEGNPLQKRQPALYRNKVRLALPQVQQIDATYVRLA